MPSTRRSEDAAPRLDLGRLRRNRGVGAQSAVGIASYDADDSCPTLVRNWFRGSRPADWCLFLCGSLPFAWARQLRPEVGQVLFCWQILRITRLASAMLVPDRHLEGI